MSENGQNSLTLFAVERLVKQIVARAYADLMEQLHGLCVLGVAFLTFSKHRHRRRGETFVKHGTSYKTRFCQMSAVQIPEIRLSPTSGLPSRTSFEIVE